MRGVLRVGKRWGALVRYSSSSSPLSSSSAPSPASPSPDIADKYAERLVRFAERIGKPAVKLSGIRYDGTVKRFYKQVDVEETPEGFAPTLGGRFMQTAGGFLVEVPSRMLATSLALEWDCQQKVIKPHLMPMMHLITQAIDQIPVKRHQMLQTMMTYVDFDSACVRDYDNAMLLRAQEKYLDPVVEWFEEQYGVKVSVSDENQLGIAPIRQSAETKKAIETILSDLTDWEYAVFEQCCGVSKSILISLAVLEGQLDMMRSFECARLEENFAMRKNGIIKGAFGHGIDVEFVKTRLASARTVINMINVDTSPHSTALRQRNSFHNPPPKPQGKLLNKPEAAEEMVGFI